MNRDIYGIIGQVQPKGSPIEVEGGDSACWNGHWIYLNKGKDPGGVVVTNADEYVDFFEEGSGGYVRHPDPEMTNNGFGAHYTNPWDGCISRDQLTGILGAMMYTTSAAPILRIISHHMLKGMLFTYNTITNGRDPNGLNFNLLKFFYNPKKENYYKPADLTLFDIWAMELRALSRFLGVFKVLLWPILMTLDLQMLFATVLFENREPLHQTDAINYTIKLLSSVEFMPTPISILTLHLCDRERLVERLEGYWSGWRDNPEFVKLYQERLGICLQLW